MVQKDEFRDIGSLKCTLEIKLVHKNQDAMGEEDFPASPQNRLVFFPTLENRLRSATRAIPGLLGGRAALSQIQI